MKKESDKQFSDEWKIIVARNVEEIEAIRSIWEQMQRDELNPAPNADINNYLSVVDSMKDSVEPYVMIIHRNDEPKAMVIGRIGRQVIPCNVGYTSILNISLRCLTVVYRGILGRPNTETCSVLIEELMRMLGRGQADVVLFSHLPIDSEIYNLARSATSLFCRDHFPARLLHWKTSLPGSYEEFLRSLSKNTRHNVRRYQNRLVSKYGDRLSVKCFTEDSQIDQLFKDTVEVAEKTYQHGLGSTFVDDAGTRNRVKLFVDRKLLAAYVLYIDDKPCAFWNGARYGKTFFTWTTGYDPSFQNDRLGLILLVRFIEALCKDQNVDVIDFGFGDAQYKQNFCNISWAEATTYIFAPRLYPTVVNALRNFTMAVGLGLKYILNKFSAVGWIKRRWRNLLRPKSSAGRV
jgi:hypothetical protein